MTAINFNDIEGCLGTNDETLYTNGVNINSTLWDTSGFISMGFRPNGDATPSSWTPTNTTLKNSVFWNGLFPWIVIYGGDAGINPVGTNTRVEIQTFECFVYSNIQKAWVDLTTNDTKQPTSEFSMNYILGGTSGTLDKRIESNGNVSYKLDSSRHPVKAYLNPKIIYGDDVGGIMISCQARLILDNPVGVDDISAGTSHLLISVGADYRPSTTTLESEFSPAKSPVALGSKFSTITGTFKTYFAVPINPPGFGTQLPNSVYYNNGGRAYLSTAFFERNMPKSFFDRPSIFNDAEFAVPLKTSIVPFSGTGSATFTRATSATVFTEEGKLITVPSGVARFSGARFVRNLFSRSEAFDQSVWLKTNVMVTNGQTDHLGGTKARLMTVGTSSTNNLSIILGSVDNIFGDEVCFSIYIKSGNWNQFVIQIQTSVKTVHQYFNLTTATLGTTNTSGGATKLDARLDSVGNGWYRVQVTGKFAQGDGNITCLLRAVKADGVANYADPDGVAGATYYVAFAMGEKTERRTLKTASSYVSSGEVASPWSGAGADSCKWFDTYHDGTPIPDDKLLGFQFCSTNRTNLVLWNRDLTNIAWIKTNITATLTQLGIDNIANQASLLTSTLANGTIFQSITASGARSSSAYIKRITGTGRIDFSRDGGATWTNITSLINSTTYTKIAIEGTSITNPSIGFRIVTLGDAIAVDFVQDEDGIDATNPIYTTTAAATRNADVLNYPNSNINDIEGTIAATVYKSDWTKNTGSVVGSTTAGLFSAGSINGSLGKDGVNTANPNSKDYTGNGKTVSSPAVQLDYGHFWAAYQTTGGLSTGVNPGAWTTIKNEIRDNPGLIGVQLRWAWGDLENDAGGTYDFSTIGTRLAELAAIPGKVGLLAIMFEHKSTIPAYLKTATYDYGQYTSSSGTNLCLWNTNLRERLRLLAVALGAYLNDKVNFSSITTQESAFGTPSAGVNNGPNFNEQAFFDGLVFFTQHLRLNLPNKLVRLSANFGGNQMLTGMPAARNLDPGISFSFPNTLPDHAGLENNQGKPGCYKYLRGEVNGIDYKNNNGVMPEVQRPDYFYTNLTWNVSRTDGYKLDASGNPTIAPSGGYRPTIRQTRDYLVTNFNVKQIIWSRVVDINTQTGKTFSQEVLEFIRLPENQIPGWGLDTSVPTIYQTNTPSGSIKMALSWMENKMFINVEGGLVGNDSTYAGTFSLANLGIGASGSGFVRDVYVWKSIISDDEKRQVTSKKGVTTFSKHK